MGTLSDISVFHLTVQRFNCQYFFMKYLPVLNNSVSLDYEDRRSYSVLPCHIEPRNA